MSPFSRFVRYQGASLLGFLLDFSIIFVLIFYANMNYLAATIVGFFAAVLFSFFVNRAWSFRKWVHPGRLAIAFFVGAATLAVVLAVTYIGVEQIKVPYLEARFVAALIAAIVSYIGDSLFTFEMEPFS